MAPTSPPNVLLICTDQWRGDCLSIDDHPVVHTPYVDALALQGVRFHRAYSPAPTCIPARASLFTGLRPRSHGFVGFNHSCPWPFDTTLAGCFAQAGYQTQAVGKMHVFPERHPMGFEGVTLHSALGIIRDARRRGLSDHDVDDYAPWLRQQLGRDDAAAHEHGVNSNSMLGRPWDKPEHTHYTNFTAAQSIRFLQQRDPNRPFFLFTSFNAPHPPFDPAEWAYELYRHRQMPPPPVGDWSDAIYGPYRGNRQHAPHYAKLDPHVLQTARAGYYGHITQIDHQINRICEELHHLNLWQNTIILFLSDHGEMLGDHHCFQKIKPYEGSAQVPMVLRAPPAMGVPQNAVRHELVELADVMPTLLDLAGVPIPDGLDGRSFAPVARGEAPADWRPIMHGEHTAGGVGGYQWLTDGREKYIWLTGTGHEQLFDLANDPEERYDLARSPDPATQARVAAWRQRLIREIEGFEEGFVQDGELVPGRPQQAVLAHLREAADRYTPPPAPRR